MRGTSTRQPNSGLVSNHDSVSRRSTTGPTTITAGGVIRAAGTSAAMFPRVETWSPARCVPVRVTETEVSGSRPAATSSAAMSPIVLTAESSTSVGWAAWEAQLIFASLHVTTATSRWVRVVSGMPA